MRVLLKIGGGLLAVLVFLLLIVVVNTLRLPGPPSGAAKENPPPANMDAATKRLSEALQIQTVSYGFANPPGGNKFPDLHELFVKSFPLVHANLKREVVAGSSLLFTWPGSDSSLQPILLTAHLDTVPIEPGTEAKWDHPPFSGAIADGFVWGRGTLDDKHRVVATLEAVERLLAAGAKPKRTVYLAFGHDEELGGQLGAKAITALLEERKVRFQFSLDEGSLIAIGAIPGVAGPVAPIGLSEKGGMTLLLTATGKAGHSSTPPQNSAVGKIGRAVARLEANQMPASLAGPGGEMLRAIAPSMPFAMRAVIANDWLFGSILKGQLSKGGLTNALIRTTTAPTIINGGVKENVLPSEATAVVNFRLAPGDTVEQVKAHVAMTIADPDVTISDYRGAGIVASPVSDKNGPGFKLIADGIRELAPDAVVTPGLVTVGTDSRHYGRISDAAYRFSPVRATPTDLARIHATNERISIANYGELIIFYSSLVRAAAM